MASRGVVRDARAEVLSDTLVWQPREDAPALHIALPEFFAEVTGVV